MSDRVFADLVAEVTALGKVPDDWYMMIRQGHGDTEVPRAFSTLMDREQNKPSLAASMDDQDRAPSRPSLRSSLAPLPSIRHDELGAVYQIAKKPGNAFDHISVGRAANVDVVLPLQRISKFHAYFRLHASGVLELADAGSMNGTWLARRRLAVRQPELLGDVSTILLGPYPFVVATPRGLATLIKESAGRTPPIRTLR